MTLLDISTGWKTAIMFTAMMVVFYFFMIRPQSQQAKKEAAYRDSLKAGDRIMTAGGRSRHPHQGRKNQHPAHPRA